MGALDFGGASTQITFETRDKIEDDTDMIRLRLYGYEYSVYTHSFLCYGQGQVLKRLMAHLVKVTHVQIMMNTELLTILILSSVSTLLTICS